MKLYLAAIAIAIAVGSAALLVNACMFQASTSRVLPIHIAQFK